MNKLPFRLLRSCLAGGLGVVLSLGARPAHADILTDWNNMALEAIQANGEASPEATRTLAMLNAAMYNAMEGIAGDHYVFTSAGYSGPSATAPDGALMEAAAAAAAHTLLQGLASQGLYAGMEADFADLYMNQLAAMTTTGRSDGINFGTAVANDILNWRSSDGSASASDPGLYTPVGTVGHWQAAPGDTASVPGWGNVSTFGITGAAAYTSTLPNGSLENYLQSAQYTADFNQVKDLGAASSISRSLDQLEAAYFWSGRAGTTTTAGLWNTIAQTVAASEGMSLQDSARLYAALNVAMADAAIVTWQTKYDTDFWSPLLAIVNGDVDGNDFTLGDDTWVALLAELDAPAYFSDISALSAAAAEVLANFLGDGVAFTLSSDYDGDGIIDDTRTYSSFSEAAEEAGLSQIWGGVSYGSANTDGAAAGQAVANEVLLNNFAPVPEPSSMLLVLVGGGFLWGRRRR